MNLYILVEGRRTEPRVYPSWLQHLLPLHTRVTAPDEVTENSYFLISGEGYPHLLDVTLPHAIEDIRETDRYGYFIVCVDADENTNEEMLTTVTERIQAANPRLPGHTIPRVIVQGRCIESWLLGNRAVFPRRPNCPILRQHIDFYNVNTHCPELMGCRDFTTHAAFHLDYLSRMLRERRVSYTKQHPGDVGETHYLEQLIRRSSTPGHMQSFRVFLELCATIRSHSPGYSV